MNTDAFRDLGRSLDGDVILPGDTATTRRARSSTR